MTHSRCPGFPHRDELSTDAVERASYAAFGGWLDDMEPNDVSVEDQKVPTEKDESRPSRVAGLGDGRRRLRGDDGMSTAEYAVGTIAAVAFAAVLFKVVQSPEVHAALVRIVTSALNISL